MKRLINFWNKTEDKIYTRRIVVYFIIILSCLLFQGCSLIPRVTFDTKGTTPQQTEKSLRKIKCKGDIILNEDGTVKTCTKGYSEYESSYEKKERKFTLKEKIINFFRKLSGLGFWGMVLIVILCPSLLGSILTFVFSASRRVARETIQAVKRFRRESAPEVKEALDNYLREEQSKETKKYISQIRKSE